MSWLHYLPPRFLPPLQALPAELRSRITEVRLRLGMPFSVTAEGRNLSPDDQGRLTAPSKAIHVTRADLDEMLSRMTDGSRYAYEEQIARGFLTLPDGCRAGIAGDTLPHPNGEGGLLFREITSVNLRISRFLPEFARPLADRLQGQPPVGVLVVSPPAGGKTTFLRSAIYLLSNGVNGTRPYRVGIADERNELSVPDGLCDRITGCPKWKAVELLTRTMSPEYLVCDELGVGEEAALLAAQNTGVRLIASVHGGTLQEAMSRPCVKPLYDAGIFGLFVLLCPGYAVRIYDAKELSVCV